MKPVLVIDPLSEWYQQQLSPKFPELDVRIAKDGHAADAGDAQAILAMGHHFNEHLIGGAKSLQWIQAFTTGVDQVVNLKSLKPGVVVTSMRGIHGTQMSEMAFLHMLVLSRGYRKMARNQDRAAWEPVIQHRLAEKTAVIVGVGLIAESMAPRCKAFDMNVVGVTSAIDRKVPGFDRMIHRKDIEQAAAIADFLIVLAPHTSENEKLISAKVIAAMKPTAFVINVARGPVVDEDALLAAVREKRIGGAGLDVFVNEPLPAEHPFWKEENIVITPRRSGSTADYHKLALPTLERNLRAFADGRMGDLINVVPR